MMAQPHEEVLLREALREELQKLTILKEVSNVSVGAGASNVEVIPETSIETYKLKTFDIKADYGLTLNFYCYDDPADFDADDPFHTHALTANRTLPHIWEEDFKYCKILVDNPDGVSGHTVTRARLKGRKL